MSTKQKAESARSDAPSNGELGLGASSVQRILKRGFHWPDDIQVVFDKDPAAKNVLEVLLYQGVHAVLLHRLAHRLYVAGVPVMPRLISQLGRLLTGGIEIHPGATIGRRFFIDHGSGVVIGETTEIGDDVMLYHQVTLGATGWWKDLNNGRARRHPKLEDRVTIGVGASVLGPVTIGADSKIGAMCLVLEDVPPKSVVIARPGSFLVREGKRVKDAWLQESEVPTGYRGADYRI